MADGKSGFLLYTEYLRHVQKLSMEQRGELFTAILCYAAGESVPELDPVTDMIFGVIQERIDRDTALYLEKVEKRREAGKLGGRPKANGFSEKQEKAKKANGFSEKQNNPDSDNDPDNVTVNNKNTLADAKAMFERLWKMYPNKKGKGQVSDTQKKRLLAIGEPTLVKAIERYSLELQKDADWRKPQYGSTFFNNGYVDYLDDNYVPGKAEKRPAAKNNFNNFEQRQYDYDELERDLLMAQTGGTGE